MTDTQPFMDEARALLDSMSNCHCDSCMAATSQALSSAYQRGRDEERAESDKRADEYYVRWADRHTASSERDKG